MLTSLRPATLAAACLMALTVAVRAGAQEGQAAPVEAADGSGQPSDGSGGAPEVDALGFNEDDPDLIHLRLDAPDDDELPVLGPPPEASARDSRWIRQWGMVSVGVGGAEGEVANPHVGLQWVAAILDDRDDPAPLEVHDVARQLWVDLRLAAEIGGGAASSGLPTASVDLTVLADRDAPLARGAPAELDPQRLWAPLRLWRNSRLDRDLAVVLPAAGYSLAVRWQERANVGTHFSLRVTSPGYVYQSAMGRAGRFHGAQLGTFAFDVGPTVRVGPRADFVWRIGGMGSLALGADRGPRLSLRSETGARMQNAFEILQRYRFELLAGYGIASDSYYDVRREDWFVRIHAAVAF